MADHPDTSESVWSRLLLRAGGLSALSSGKIITLSLIGPLGLACVFGAMVLKSRTDRLNEAVFNGEAISSWLSQDIAGDLNPCDMALRAVAETMGRPDVAMRPDGARLLPPIRHPGAVCPGHLLVLNEAGDIVADGEAARSRPETLAAIGALAALRRAGDTGLRVSRPFRGPFDASWTIGLGRRLSRPEGGFAGEALVLLPLGHLRTLLDRPPLRYGTVVALMHADGMLLLTRPYGEDRIGRDLRDGPLFRATTGGVSGSFAASAPAGILPPAGNPPGGGDAPPAGGRWIYSFSRAGDLPLIVCVGLARSTLLRDWRSEVLAAGMVVAALSAGCAFLIFLLLQELRRRRAAEEAACLSEERYRLLAEHSSDAIVLHDGEGQRRYASPVFHRLIGRHRADLPDEALLASVHPDHRDRLAACRRNIRRMQGETAIEFLYGRADGHWVWLEARCRPVLDAQGRQRGLVSNLRDITRRKLAEDELARRVMTDSLTGLANRRCFDEALERHWSREAEAWMPIALLMLDADHFKAYNDQYGHPAGDEVLRTVAGCIRKAARRPTDLAARYGGEEFVMLLPGSDAIGAAGVAEAIREAVAALNLPHAGSPTGFVTVSLGVAAIMPALAEGSAVLLRMADRALYDAKRQGRNHVAIAGAESEKPAVPAG